MTRRSGAGVLQQSTDPAPVAPLARAERPQHFAHLAGHLAPWSRQRRGPSSEARDHQTAQVAEERQWRSGTRPRPEATALGAGHRPLRLQPVTTAWMSAQARHLHRFRRELHCVTVVPEHVEYGSEKAARQSLPPRPTLGADLSQQPAEGPLATLHVAHFAHLHQRWRSEVERPEHALRCQRKALRPRQMLGADLGPQPAARPEAATTIGTTWRSFREGS